MQDIALLKLHVIFAVDRAGLVGEDGETHHGVFDVGFLRQVPGMRILCPGSTAELSQMLAWAIDAQGPIAIRYPRGVDRGFEDICWPALVQTHGDGEGVAIITYGTMLSNALDAAEQLNACAVRAKVIRLLQIAPLPVDELVQQLGDVRRVVVLEEVQSGSGIGHQLAYLLKDRCVTCLNLGEDFVTHGKLNELYRERRLDGSSVKNTILEVLRNED